MRPGPLHIRGPTSSKGGLLSAFIGGHGGTQTRKVGKVIVVEGRSRRRIAEGPAVAVRGKELRGRRARRAKGLEIIGAKVSMTTGVKAQGDIKIKGVRIQEE